MHAEAATLLPAIARAAISDALGAPAAAIDLRAHDWLLVTGASFVTLSRGGALRGCIGSLEARRALLADLRANAVAAALHDPRFAPLSPIELEQVRVEVSLLSAAEPVVFDGEADALRQLRPGIDGLILQHGPRRSTFLPQVWEQLPEPRGFVGQLKRKAGLPADFWHESIRLLRYTVVKFRESTNE